MLVGQSLLSSTTTARMATFPSHFQPNSITSDVVRCLITETSPIYNNVVAANDSNNPFSMTADPTNLNLNEFKSNGKL